MHKDIQPDNTLFNILANKVIDVPKTPVKIVFGILITGQYDFVTVQMPCGQTINFKKPSDFPEKDMPCPCGDPTHWVVKYRETDEDV